jgi:uncharacterized protein
MIHLPQVTTPEFNIKFNNFVYVNNLNFLFMKKTFFLLFLGILINIQGLIAQNQWKANSTGTWLGNLQTGAIELRMVFNIRINDKDSLVATLDSPDQGAKNIPLGRVIVDKEKFTIQAPGLLGIYNGTWSGDSAITGTWTQRGSDYPLNLKKLKGPFSINRPQEPKPPFPYLSEDISFMNNVQGIKLAGTLTMPRGNGPFKAAILITGSGAQNRNEELLGHKPFMVIADYLTRNGVAVLRFDDRGVGGSQGKYSDATSADLATDVQAAFDFLKTNPRIDPGKIGLIGHSEGGLIAPIVASANHSVAFIVSLAGPGVTGQQIIIRQQQDISHASKVKESAIKETTEINKKLYSVLRKEKDNAKAEAKILGTYRTYLQKKKMSKTDIDKAVFQLKMQFGSGSYTWFRYFITTDPSVFWKKTECPVLALNGEKDLQVSANENLPAIEKALKSGGNKKILIRKLPGLNHLFQHCSTGLPAEYSSIEETFSPEALSIIGDWINKQ